LPRHRLEQQSELAVQAAFAGEHVVPGPSSPAPPSVFDAEPSDVPPSSPAAFELVLPHASGAAASATNEPKAKAVSKR
jgi:hypothetical protein